MLKVALLFLVLTGLLALPVWAATRAPYCSLLDSNGCCGSTCQQKTCAVLKTVGGQLGFSYWKNRSGWQSECGLYQYSAPSSPPQYCSWHGIGCNASLHSSTCSQKGLASGISEIQLTNNGLVGQINSSGLLTALKQLHDCGLTRLVMGGASFGLRGTISPAFGEFDKLQVLALFTTNITGTIPPEIGSMSALRELDLSLNFITGTFPPEISSLTNLQLLNLGYNGFTDMGREFTGTLPASIVQLTSLEILMLEFNTLIGTLPPDMCTKMTKLRALSLRSNKFKGFAHQFGNCTLTALDLADNSFSGPLPVPDPNTSAWQSLQSLRLNGNSFTGTLPSFEYGEAPLLSALILNNNSLTGTLPVSWTFLPWLTLVDASFNELSGTLPWELAFQSKLSVLALHNNRKLTGSIGPSWRFSVALSVLMLQNTDLKGPLPGVSRAMFDSGAVPLNKVCNSNASGLGRLPSLESASIAGTRMSAKCADNRGLCHSIEEALPWYLVMDGTAWQVPPAEVGFSNNENMECPMVVQDRFCGRNGLPEDIREEERPRWAVSPSYYHYQACRCQGGFEASWDLRKHGDLDIYVLTCSRPLTAAQVAGISVSVSFVGLCLLGYCLYVSWSGRWGLPKLKRAYVDVKKRLHGVPSSGRVSLVVTDIESYSALMVAMPLVMGRALAQHNTVIRKAAWTHFGFIVGQEGDCFIVAFREALDAVALCLQVQQALQRIDWPPELLQHLQNEASNSAATAAAATAKTTSPHSSTDSLPLAAAGNTSVLLADSSGVAADCNSHPASSVDQFGSCSSAAGGSRLWPFRPFSSSPSVAEDGSNHSKSPLGPQTSSGTPTSPPAATAAAASSGAPTNATLQQQQQQQQVVPAITSLVLGLRVRMGVASGVLEDKEDVLSCKVLDVARVVSDAAAGGQVLLDSTTFVLVKDRLEELGQIGPSGYVHSRRVVGWGTPKGWMARLVARRVPLMAEALVLDMGMYTIPGFRHSTARDASGLLPDLPGLKSLSSTASASTAVDGSVRSVVAAGSRALQQTHSCGRAEPAEQMKQDCSAQGGEYPPVTAAAAAAVVTRSYSKAKQAGCLRLYQVLAPRLLERAHLFGNRLSLADGTLCFDLPFFCAPAAASRFVQDTVMQQQPFGLTDAKGSASGSSNAFSRIFSQQRQQKPLLAIATAGGSSSSNQEGDVSPDAAGTTADAPACLHTIHTLHQTAGSRAGSNSSNTSSFNWWRPRWQLQRQKLLSAAASAASDAAGQASSCSRAAPDSQILWQQPAVPKSLCASRLSSPPGLFDGDDAATFVFCSVVSPKSIKLGMDVNPKLTSQVSTIVGRVIRQTLMAFTSATAAAAAAAGGGGCAGAGSSSSSSSSSAALMACGYLCRDMSGDMKYILAFNSPRVALEWCMLVQEVMLWQDWPPALLEKHSRQADRSSNPSRHLAATKDTTAAAAAGQAAAAGSPVPAEWMAAAAAALAIGGGRAAALSGAAADKARGGVRPLFRGPRIKMGVACGAPQSVAPDHMGRADYHGNAVNMAARYEAVCSQGGQVVCDAQLAEAVVAEWQCLATATATAAMPATATAAAEPPKARPGVAGGSNSNILVEANGLDSQQQHQQQFAGGKDKTPFAHTGRPDNSPPAAALSPLGGRGCATEHALSWAVPCTTRSSPLAVPGRSASHIQQPRATPSAATGSMQLVGSAPATSPAITSSSGAPVQPLQGSLVSKGAAVAGCMKGAGGSVQDLPRAGIGKSVSGSGLASRLGPGSKGSCQLWSTGPRRGAAAAASRQAATVVIEPAPLELPCQLCVPQLPSESFDVEVHRVGKFLVKGHSGPVEMVEVVLSHLAMRRHYMAASPPKSQKGSCIQAQSGRVAAVSGVQLPGLAQLYRQQHEQSVTAVAAAEAQSPFTVAPRQRSAVDRASSMWASFAASMGSKRPESLTGSAPSDNSLLTAARSSSQPATQPLQQQQQQQQQLQQVLLQPQ